MKTANRDIACLTVFCGVELGAGAVDQAPALLINYNIDICSGDTPFNLVKYLTILLQVVPSLVS